MATRSLLVCGLILVSIQLVFGHGYLALPKSRNYLANLAGVDYCPHCLNSGGPATVSSLTPGGLFPEMGETDTSVVRNTICGEAGTLPIAQRVYNPAAVPAVSSLPVYTPGQEIDVTVVITAHHRGHFEFRLCDASKLANPTTTTWECLKEATLQRVSVPGEVSPVDVNRPERYYLEPACSAGYNTTTFMKYKLPSNITCERCVLQWWWISANTCNPPYYANRSPVPSYGAGCVWWEPTLPVCGTAYPEEFWNCADIRIVGSAGTPGTATAPPPSKPVAPPTKPAAPPAQPVAPPTKPAAPPAKPVAPPVAPTKPAAPPAKPVAPPTKPAAPPAKPAAAPKKPAAPSKPAAPAQPTGPVWLPCAILGAQCGGEGWTGSTCCQSGICMAYLPTFSQCRTGTCPAGWLCSSSKDQSLMTSAVEWAKRFFA